MRGRSAIQKRFVKHLFALLCLAGTDIPLMRLQAQEKALRSLTLTEAIDLAIKQNRNVQLSHLSVSESQYRKEVARAAYLPQITNQSGIIHVSALAGVQIPAGSLGVPSATGPIPSQTLFIGQGSDTSYTSGTQLTQPLTQLLKIRESNRAAAADVAISKIHVTQAEDEVVLRVRQIYFAMLIAQQKLVAAQEQLKAAQTVYRESSDKLASGEILKLTALESRAAELDAMRTSLSERLQTRDLMLSLDDVLGLPLSTQLMLIDDTAEAALSLPARDQCVQMALERSTSVLEARQAVVKAKAGLAAAKDAYIPDVTGITRYSYQSGVPLLVHNFGSFGFNLTYTLFDGGRRWAETKNAHTLLSEAELNLTRTRSEVEVAIESSYDKVEELQSLVDVATESLAVRLEGARLADRRIEQDAALESDRAKAHAGLAAAKASLLEARLGVSLAQADLLRIAGNAPR